MTTRWIGRLPSPEAARVLITVIEKTVDDLHRDIRYHGPGMEEKDAPVLEAADYLDEIRNQLRESAL